MLTSQQLYFSLEYMFSVFSSIWSFLFLGNIITYKTVHTILSIHLYTIYVASSDFLAHLSFPGFASVFWLGSVLLFYW